MEKIVFPIWWVGLVSSVEGGGGVDVTPRMRVDLVLSVGAGEKQTKFGWAWSNQLKGTVAPRVWAGLI